MRFSQAEHAEKPAAKNQSKLIAYWSSKQIRILIWSIYDIQGTSPSYPTAASWVSGSKSKALVLSDFGGSSPEECSTCPWTKPANKHSPLNPFQFVKQKHRML